MFSFRCMEKSALHMRIVFILIVESRTMNRMALFYICGRKQRFIHMYLLSFYLTWMRGGFVQHFYATLIYRIRKHRRNKNKRTKSTCIQHYTTQQSAVFLLYFGVPTIQTMCLYKKLLYYSTNIQKKEDI